MLLARFTGLVVAGVVLLAPAAQASELPTMQADGTVELRSQPGVGVRDRTPATHLEGRRPAAGRAPGARAATSRRETPGPTVAGELRRLYDASLIDEATYLARLDAYQSFKAAVPRFSGRRRIDMAGVLRIVDGIAARAQLTPSRLPALWLTLERNREWWNTGPLLWSGQRVAFEDSELVWQYVPGEGIHIHPLATFGKLNALWRSRSGAERMEALMDELLGLAAERAGGLAWEYYFDFGGGSPPWVSGLAQGTGLQAISRAALKAGRAADVLPVARRALGIFHAPPPEGVRVAGEGGIHYLQYSFATELRILNGFVQSLVGLYDFAVNAQDAEAQQLFAEGEASARNEVPAFDTGAWSLYSRGSSTRESDLNYHAVLRDFLASLCARTAEPVYCDTQARFSAYLQEGPALALITRRLRGGRAGDLRFSLSKISTVSVLVKRGSAVVLWRSAVLGHGLKVQRFSVPRRAGNYAVSVVATDLAGNRSTVSGTVRVLKPRR